MRRSVLAMLAVAVLAAGCLGIADEEGDPGARSPNASHGAAKIGLDLAPAVNVSTRWPGSEPVVDVGPAGTVYVEGIGQTEPLDDTGDLATLPLVNRVWRSTDDGATWTDITPPLTGGNRSCDGFVAVDGDGTVYAANCYTLAFVGTGATTLEVYRSQDRGETWDRLPVPPFPEPIHRMWLVPDGEDTVHLAVEGLFPHGGLYHLVTRDDGDTWAGPTPVDLGTFFGSDLAVGPEGTLFAARMDMTFEQDTFRYTGPWWMRVSTDGGLTWTRHEMFGLDGELAASWQSLTVDPNGTVYMVWAETLDGTARLRYAYSTDQGASWEGPVSLGEADASHTMVWATARAPGELVLTWYEANARGAPGELDARWNATAGVIRQADTDEAELHETRAATWPVHEGPICTRGPFCEDDREVLDYTWATMGPEGRAHLAFASSRWDNPAAFPVYVGQPEAPPSPGSDR